MVFADGYKAKEIEPQTRDEFDNLFLENADWVEKYNFKFRKCSESGKMLWPFTKVYYGTMAWMGPGYPALEEKWMDGPTFTYMRLTGKV